MALGRVVIQAHKVTQVSSEPLVFKGLTDNLEIRVQRACLA